MVIFNPVKNGHIDLRHSNISAFLIWKTVLLLSVVLCGCSYRVPATNSTLDEKIGQMLMVGFRGTAVNENPWLLEDIRERHLGGVILFDYDVIKQQHNRNIESALQIKKLVNQLQNISATPLLIAIDQEGGQVARLNARDGFPATVSHRKLGRRDDLRTTVEQSESIATTLKELGINLNLAPVIDLCSNPDNPVIAKYGRCFSAEPEKVTAHASAYIEGHHRHGILTALKHFPGHGSSGSDSHLGFTDVSKTWRENELIPYRQIIASGQVDTVMTAHVFNDRLDVLNPATLSHATINGLLRQQLGFAGVVLSDDLQMGAIANYFGFEATIRKALDAGVDILVFGNNLSYDEQIVPRAVTVIRDLVNSGILSAARIDQSYQRILQLKQRIR